MKVELKHDQLAPRIIAKASAEALALRKAQRFLEERYEFYQDEKVLLRAKDLEYLGPFKAQLLLNQEQAQFYQKSLNKLSGQRRNRIIGAAIGAAFVALAVFAILQYFRANERTQFAQEQRDFSVKRTSSINKGIPILIQKQDSVKGSKNIVDSLFQIAENAQRATEIEAIKAQEAAGIMISARDQAQFQQARAEALRQKAVRDSILARSQFYATTSRQDLSAGDFRAAFFQAKAAFEWDANQQSREALSMLRISPFQMGFVSKSKISQWAIAKDGQSLAYAVDGQGLFLYGRDGAEILVQALSDDVTQLEVLSAQKGLIYALANGEIRYYDANTRKESSWQLGLENKAFVLDEANDRLFFCQNDTHWSLASLQDESQIKSFPYPASSRIYFIPRSKDWLVAEQRYLKRTNLEQDTIWQIRYTLRKNVLFSPQATQLLNYSYKYGSADLLDILYGRIITKYRNPGNQKLVSCQFHPDYQDSSYWRFDMDRDGVPPRFDFEKDTPFGSPVDKLGKALDSDQDGVIDWVDLEAKSSTIPLGKVSVKTKIPELYRYRYPQVALVESPEPLEEKNTKDDKDNEPFTPESVAVKKRVRALRDEEHIPTDLIADNLVASPQVSVLKRVAKEYVDVMGMGKDTDRDGIVDALDEEPNTPFKAPVDAKGNAIDTDGDGWIDLYDREKRSPEGAKVDNLGVAYDVDFDGVIDLYDQELETEPYAPVDADGIALDSDGDNVIDPFDLEPNTPSGSPVNKSGQADQDQDGIADGTDLEPETPKGDFVDSLGRADKDFDGIYNAIDQEKYTPEGAKSDAQGIAIDSDGDGLPDLIDFEQFTPPGTEVDAFGRTPKTRGQKPPYFSLRAKVVSGPDPRFLDDDGDYVPNVFDKEPNTAKGAWVDREGRTIDIDGDGVPAHLDLQKMTPQGAPIDSLGIALDSDSDGVIDLFDQEALTPPNLLVDRNGKTIDRDGDGVPFSLDKYPYTPTQVKVDSLGMPLDLDDDTVFDFADAEPSTPAGVRVDKNGINLNQDQDGIPYVNDPDNDGDAKLDNDLILAHFVKTIVLIRNTGQSQSVKKIYSQREEIQLANFQPDFQSVFLLSAESHFQAWLADGQLTSLQRFPKRFAAYQYHAPSATLFAQPQDQSIRLYFKQNVPPAPLDIITFYQNRLAPLTEEEHSDQNAAL